MKDTAAPKDIEPLTGADHFLSWEDLDPEDRLERILHNEVTSEWFLPRHLDVLAGYYPVPHIWGQIIETFRSYHGVARNLDKAVVAWRQAQQETPPTAGAPATPAPAGTVWDQAITIAAFCQQDEEEIPADARDLIIAGCITLIAAPRASGKTLVMYFLALALALGGTFRGEQLPKRRVLLVDRDNPPALSRKRFRLLGGDQVEGMKLLTRDKAPPLTDAAAWATFPVEQYAVVIIDSLSAATEGVSEKEGKETQQYLAVLKDLAQRGPAILVLDNTNKAAVSIRGRGEKTAAADIVYEARNITGWTPTQGGDWWESLPDGGEHAWQQRASRHKGQAVLRLAFVSTKFRGGADPAPFALEIDTRQEPWTLADITDEIATAGVEAAQEQSRQERYQLTQASAALVQALRQRAPRPIYKREAELLLQTQGLTKRVAKMLLEVGGNRDLYPEGQWVLRALTNERGNPVAVSLTDVPEAAAQTFVQNPVGEGESGPNNLNTNPASHDATSDFLISDTRMKPSGPNNAPRNTSNQADESNAVFGPPHEHSMDEIDTYRKSENTGVAEGGGISATHPPSSDKKNHTHAEPDEEPCLHEHVDDLGSCNDCGQEVT
jgi:hypothetical protein